MHALMKVAKTFKKFWQKSQILRFFKTNKRSKMCHLVFLNNLLASIRNAGSRLDAQSKNASPTFFFFLANICQTKVRPSQC